MNDWSGGYITDVAYLLGYHPEQAPAHLALTALINGVASDLIAEPEHLAYLELGSGLGFGATVLAASNPLWRVIGIDFNPAHVAAARAFAADAGVANVIFIEGDLATLADDGLAEAIPAIDVASLHGVWSWVSEEARRGILRLLSAKVRAGGLVQVSYNALPAWQGALGMQRLLRAAGRRLATRSDRQAVQGLEVVRNLAEAGADNLAAPFTRKLLERLADAEPGYLAHEFMNGNWAPCFHADVAAAFAAAKFSFVGSARLYENFPDLMLNEAQRLIAARFDDPLLFELIKDVSAGPALRQDVYVRGLHRLSEAERNEALGAIPLVLTMRPSGFQYETQMPAGKATLNRNFYGPVVERLAAGPQPIRDLLALPGREHDRINAPELAAMLVGSGQAMVALRPTAPPARRLDRFHAAAARRLARTSRLDHPVALASPRIGAGLVVPVLELLVLSRLVNDGPAEPIAWARMLAPALKPEKQQVLAETIARILDERAQIWRLAGLI